MDTVPHDLATGGKPTDTIQGRSPIAFSHLHGFDTRFVNELLNEFTINNQFVRKSYLCF